jgi:hypothetical protein
LQSLALLVSRAREKLMGSAMEEQKTTPLVPRTDKVSRDPAEHPDRIPAERVSHPVTLRDDRRRVLRRGFASPNRPT